MEDNPIYRVSQRFGVPTTSIGNELIKASKRGLSTGAALPLGGVEYIAKDVGIPAEYLTKAREYLLSIARNPENASAVPSYSNIEDMGDLPLYLSNLPDVLGTSVLPLLATAATMPTGGWGGLAMSGLTGLGDIYQRSRDYGVEPPDSSEAYPLALAYGGLDHLFNKRAVSAVTSAIPSLSKYATKGLVDRVVGPAKTRLGSVGKFGVTQGIGEAATEIPQDYLPTLAARMSGKEGSENIPYPTREENINTGFFSGLSGGLTGSGAGMFARTQPQIDVINKEDESRFTNTLYREFQAKTKPNTPATDPSNKINLTAYTPQDRAMTMQEVEEHLVKKNWARDRFNMAGVPSASEADTTGMFGRPVKKPYSEIPMLPRGGFDPSGDATQTGFLPPSHYGSKGEPYWPSAKTSMQEEAQAPLRRDPNQLDIFGILASNRALPYTGVPNPADFIGAPSGEISPVQAPAPTEPFALQRPRGMSGVEVHNSRNKLGMETGDPIPVEAGARFPARMHRPVSAIPQVIPEDVGGSSVRSESWGDFLGKLRGGVESQANQIPYMEQVPKTRTGGPAPVSGRPRTREEEMLVRRLFNTPTDTTDKRQLLIPDYLRQKIEAGQTGRPLATPDNIDQLSFDFDQISKKLEEVEKNITKGKPTKKKAVETQPEEAAKTEEAPVTKEQESVAEKKQKTPKGMITAQEAIENRNILSGLKADLITLKQRLDLREVDFKVRGIFGGTVQELKDRIKNTYTKIKNFEDIIDKSVGKVIPPKETAPNIKEVEKKLAAKKEATGKVESDLHPDLFGKDTPIRTRYEEKEIINKRKEVNPKQLELKLPYVKTKDVDIQEEHAKREAILDKKNKLTKQEIKDRKEHDERRKRITEAHRMNEREALDDLDKNISKMSTYKNIESYLKTLKKNEAAYAKKVYDYFTKDRARKPQPVVVSKTRAEEIYNEVYAINWQETAKELTKGTGSETKVERTDTIKDADSLPPMDYAGQAAIELFDMRNRMPNVLSVSQKKALAKKSNDVKGEYLGKAKKVSVDDYNKSKEFFDKNWDAIKQDIIRDYKSSEDKEKAKKSFFENVMKPMEDFKGDEFRTTPLRQWKSKKAKAEGEEETEQDRLTPTAEILNEKESQRLWDILSKKEVDKKENPFIKFLKEQANKHMEVYNTAKAVNNRGVMNHSLGVLSKINEVYNEFIAKKDLKTSSKKTDAQSLYTHNPINKNDKFKDLTAKETLKHLADTKTYNKALDNVREAINKYGVASVQDFFSFYGIEEVLNHETKEKQKEITLQFEKAQKELGIDRNPNDNRSKVQQMHTALLDSIKAIAGNRDINLSLVDYIDVQKYPELIDSLISEYGVDKDVFNNGGIMLFTDRIPGVTTIENFSSDEIKIVVDVAYKVSRNMKETINHEAFHVLERLGVFSEEEIKIFKEKFSEGKTSWREQAADKFGKYMAGVGPVPTSMQKIVNKVKSFLERLHNKMRGLGFKNADSIFQSIKSGEYKDKRAKSFMALTDYADSRDFAHETAGFGDKVIQEKIDKIIADYGSKKITDMEAMTKLQQLAKFSKQDIMFKKTHPQYLDKDWDDINSYGKNKIMLVNPTSKEITDLFNKSNFKELRGILDSRNGDMYVWDADWSTHDDMHKGLEIEQTSSIDFFIAPKASSSKAGNIFGVKDLKKLYELKTSAKTTKTFLQLLSPEEMQDAAEEAKRLIAEGQKASAKNQGVWEPSKFLSMIMSPEGLSNRNKFMDGVLVAADHSEGIKETRLTSYTTTSVKKEIEAHSQDKKKSKDQELLRLSRESADRLAESGVLWNEKVQNIQELKDYEWVDKQGKKQKGFSTDEIKAYYGTRRKHHEVITNLYNGKRERSLNVYSNRVWFNDLKSLIGATFDKERAKKHKGQEHPIIERRKELAKLVDDKKAEIREKFKKDGKPDTAEFRNFFRAYGELVKIYKQANTDEKKLKHSGYYFHRARGNGKFVIEMIDKLSIQKAKDRVSQLDALIKVERDEEKLKEYRQERADMLNVTGKVQSIITDWKLSEKSERKQAEEIIIALREKYKDKDRYEIQPVKDAKEIPEEVREEASQAETMKFLESAMARMDAGTVDDSVLLSLQKSMTQLVEEEFKSMSKAGSSFIQRRRTKLYNEETSTWEDNDILGYKTEDVQTIYFNYMNNMANMESRLSFQSEAFKILNEVQRFGKDPNELRNQKTMVKLPRTYDMIKKYVTDMLTPESNADRFTNILRSIAFTKFMGYNPRMGFVQVFQNFLTGMPVMSRYLRDLSHVPAVKALGNSVTIYSKAMKDIVKYYASGNKDALTKEEIAYLDTAWNDGTTKAQFINQMRYKVLRDTGSMPSYASRAWKKFSDGSAWIFARSEEFNRRSALLAMYRVQQAANPSMTIEEHLKIGKQFVYRTHYLMGKLNMPEFVRRNNIIKFLYTFKGFTQQYVEQLILFSLNKDGKVELRNLDVAAKSLGVLFLLGGMSSMPLLPEILEFIEKKTKIPYRIKIARLFGREDSPLFRGISFGLPAVFGMDFSSSVKMDILPSDWKWFLGVYGGLEEKHSESLRQLGMADYPSALESSVFTPIGFENILKAYRMKTYGGTSKSGHTVYDYEGKPLKLDFHEAALQLVGIKPVRMGTSSLYKRSSMNISKSYETEKYKIYEMYREASREKDLKMFSKLKKEMTKFNLDRKKYGKGIPPITVESLKRSMSSKPNKLERVFYKGLE